MNGKNESRESSGWISSMPLSPFILDVFQKARVYYLDLSRKIFKETSHILAQKLPQIVQLTVDDTKMMRSAHIIGLNANRTQLWCD